MNLCLALGYASRRTLKASMTAKDYADWWTYWQISPWGDARADLRAGIVASVCAAPHVKKGRRCPKPIDFMPYAKRDAAQDVAEAKARVRSAAADWPGNRRNA